MAREIFYGMMWKVDPRKYPDSMAALAEITGVPDRFNRTELPLEFSYNGRTMRFWLLGKDHVERFLRGFDLQTGEYRNLVGNTVKILGRKHSLEEEVVVEPLYGIKPATASSPIVRESRN